MLFVKFKAGAVIEALGRSSRWIKWQRGVRRWYKRATSKLRRRYEREDPENVPPRMTKGWAW